jgi:curved DNA-binding protein CbpA
MNNQPRNDTNENKDLYAILRLHKLCTAKEIKHAYRLLASKWHPDRNDSPEAAEMFRDAHMAYTVLSNPTTRQQYDNTGKWNKQINNEEMRIRNDIIQLFAQAVDTSPVAELPLILDKMREAASYTIRVLNDRSYSILAQEDKWNKVIKRITNKGDGDDSFIYKYAKDKLDQLNLEKEDTNVNKSHWSSVICAINNIKYDSSVNGYNGRQSTYACSPQLDLFGIRGRF